MTRTGSFYALLAMGVTVVASVTALGQSQSQNAKPNRQWSLKGGPGAPHNIMPIGDVSRSDEDLFLRVAKVSPEYVLGDGDRLSVSVIGGGALNDSLASLTIGNAGTITIPYLGNIQASGLTAGQLEDQITRLLAERQLLKNPEVLVYITDYKARPYFVMGEVDNPGEYMMSQEITLMEAILLAGGIDPTAGSEAFLYRRRGPAGSGSAPLRVPENPEVAEPGVDITRIDIRPLKLGGVPDPDILMQKGDLLLIPKAKDNRYFVVGDVRTPGAQIIPQPVERVMFASQAIAQAGGPNKTAKMSEGILVRYDADGQRQEVPVDFLAILQRRRPDIEIRANDIIFIPSSNAKMLGYGMLGVIPQRVEMRGRMSVGR